MPISLNRLPAHVRVVLALLCAAAGLAVACGSALADSMSLSIPPEPLVSGSIGAHGVYVQRRGHPSRRRKSCGVLNLQAGMRGPDSRARAASRKTSRTM